MKKFSTTLLALILFLAHGAVLANDTAPVPETGSTEGESGTGSDADTEGDKEPDC